MAGPAPTPTLFPSCCNSKVMFAFLVSSSGHKRLDSATPKLRLPHLLGSFPSRMCPSQPPPLLILIALLWGGGSLTTSHRAYGWFLPSHELSNPPNPC